MTALELCTRADLKEDAGKLAAEDTPVSAYIEELARSERSRDSIAALTQVLPKVDAISWGLHSIRRINQTITDPKADAAARSVEEWIADPNEERRRTAHRAAEAAGIGTPAGCLAFGVFLSGGSMAPPDAPVAPEPPPHVCGRIVAGAMALAVAMDPQNATELLRTFLAHGLHLARQLELWKESKPAQISKERG